MTDRLAGKGPYVMSSMLAAGRGWCEAITAQNEHCCTAAKFERDGRDICGLHQRAKSVRFGPERKVRY